MRFLIGLLIGFAAGFAGALLFAPEKGKAGEVEWPQGVESPAPGPAAEGNGTMAALQRAAQGLRKRVNQALEEAKKAQQEAEREMQARYEKVAGRSGAKPR